MDTVVCGGVSLPRHVCLAPTAALWSCCGLVSYHHIAPAALWLVFLSLTACAQYYYNLFHDLNRTADELHDIQTQALGVVVARRKRVIFGKTYRDPRRLLMLGAMWSELFGFSYTPGQLVICQLTQSDIKGLVPGPLQFVFFVACSVLLYLLEGPLGARWLRKCHLRRPKLGGPILYDTFFMVCAQTLVNVVSCTNGVDSVALGNNFTCASPERYWVVCSLGLGVFGCFFWGTLKYKKQLASDVYAVSFRFQASFDAMMTCTRTICALTALTVEKALLVLDVWLVAVLFGLLNLVHFGALLRYNYRCQPCLGVGLVPNNLRALSFATSCYTTLVSLVISILQIARHHAVAGTAEWTVCFVAVGLYPVVAVTVWRWNGRRAILFHVPNLSLLDALQHETDRVRAVAAVTVTLETTERDTNMLQSILLALDVSLARSIMAETAYAAAYACQATWFLWYTNFDLSDHIAENDAEQFVPFGCWVQLPSIRSSLTSLAMAPSRRRLSLSGSRSWRPGTKAGNVARPSPQVASHAHASPVAPTLLDTSRKSSGVLRGGTTEQSTLLQLVEKATDLTYAVCMTTRIVDDMAIRMCFEHAVKKLAELCRCSCRRSRLVASKVLQEMYHAGVVQVSRTTFFYVAANLTASPSYTKAVYAARTLVQFVNDRDDAWVGLHVADEITLRLVVDAMHLHRLDGDFVTSLLTVLLQGFTTLAALGGRGPSAATYLDRSLVAAFLELQSHPLSALAAARLDDVLATLHEIWEKPSNRLWRIVRRMPNTRIFVSSMVRPSDTAYTLVTAAQLKLIHDRQRTRRELVATVHCVLAEGFVSSARRSDLSDVAQTTVATLSLLLSTRSDLLSYVHSQLTTPEYWYVCDLIGRPRPRMATAATRCREDR